MTPITHAAPQTPLGTGFGPHTTADEVIAGHDLHGSTAVVTGGYSGLGLETARVLATAGARVIVPARDVERARAALAHLPQVTVAPLDLMDPASIDAFAAELVAGGQPLHRLINGAGVMAAPLRRDADGHESQFSTNHLGHFRLTLRLWPALRAAGGARVVCVSSRGHAFAPVDLDDPDFLRRPYDKWLAYGQSKTANALFALALDARGAADGVRAYSLHPGAIYTPLTRHMDMDDFRRVGAVGEDGKLLSTESAGFKTVAQGAATAVWCATSPLLADLGGVYCEDCDVAPIATAQAGGSGVQPWAADPAQADALWAMSVRMTGVDLPRA